MIKKLISIGNSYGLVIDKAILDLLRITPDTALELTTDGVALIVTPVRDDKKRAPVKEPVREPERRREPVKPAPKPAPKRPEPRYGFPKKQPW